MAMRWRTLAAGAAALLMHASATEAPRRPNFVFILADDLGWRDLGAYGSTFHQTPNLDRLARQGVRFNQAYAACPVCSPTRASILTGKYPVRLGATDWFGAPGPEGYPGRKVDPPAHADRLPLGETTITEALKEAGYRTFFAGKWHLGPEGFWPEDQGFDINKGGWTSGGPYGGGKYFSPYGNPRLTDGPPGEQLCERLADETSRFIESSRGKPFFACLWFYSVHEPVMTTDALKAKYGERAMKVAPGAPRYGTEHSARVRLVQDNPVYAGMLETMDGAVGRVLDALERSGQADNTWVIFTSDNGGLSTAASLPTSNVPLRAGKGWLYEGGIREPLIVRGPGLSRSGRTSDATVISTDFYPTMLDLAGLPPRPEQHLDGVSFVPVLRGRPAPSRPAVYWHYPHYWASGQVTPGGAVRSGDWKLIEWFEGGAAELYNVRKDRGEKTDLARRNPDKAAEMARLLGEWRDSVGAKMPVPTKRQ